MIAIVRTELFLGNKSEVIIRENQWSKLNKVTCFELQVNLKKFIRNESEIEFSKRE